MFPIADMGQFGLSATNSHWGYSTANPYSSYLGPAGALGSCAAAGGGFSAPALGFSTAASTAASDLNGGGQGGAHDSFGAASAVSSSEYCQNYGSRLYPSWNISLWCYYTCILESHVTPMGPIERTSLCLWGPETWVDLTWVLSRFSLKTETESSLRNSLLLIKDRKTDNVQKCES
jgi:hypothetical protein